MAISINELIAKKEELAAKKEAMFDMETSIGTITVKKPSRAMVVETVERESDNDEYLIINQVVNPNLKDRALLDAYGCLEPLDIVGKIFEPGEISAISKEILRTAGYGADIKVKLHEELKN